MSLRAATATAATMAGRPRKACRRTARWFAPGGAGIVGAGEITTASAAITRAAAQQIEHRAKVGLDRVEPVRIDAAVSEQGVEELIGRIGDEDEIVVEERLQPQADAVLHPIGIEVHADVADTGLRRGDALNSRAARVRHDG